MFIALATTTILNVSIYLRDYGKKNAEEKAELVAMIVRDVLTSEMINNTIDKREFFLRNISSHQKIKSLRVLRSDAVAKQYGLGTQLEHPQDEIDKYVLSKAQSVKQLIESSDGVILRVSIPYIASKNDSPNCLDCHQAKDGDVLGAISMEFDIQDVRTNGIIAIVKIIAISLIILIIVVMVTNYLIKPYIKLFDDLEDGIKKAYRGDFSYKITTTLKNEAGDVAKRLNELSEIYRFKKTIELDRNKEAIYNRIIYILNEKFYIENFFLYEIDNIQKKRYLYYRKEDNQIGDDMMSKDALKCRAYRTSLNVISSDFPNLCLTCSKYSQFYICLPLKINENKSLLLHIDCKNEEDLESKRALIPIIKNYFETAQPVIESKILMEILKENALRDGLTTLYNRRYLEEFIDAQNELMNRDSFVILMLDIDFFKMVNDTYGHDVGDIVIKALSDVMLHNSTDNDIAIRYGGEEFLLLLRDKSKEKAVNIAEKIKNEFGKLKFTSGSSTFQKSVSIGISLYPDDANSVWKTIKFADIALYDAKNTGRDKIVVFKQDMFKSESF